MASASAGDFFGSIGLAAAGRVGVAEAGAPDAAAGGVLAGATAGAVDAAAVGVGADAAAGNSVASSSTPPITVASGSAAGCPAAIACSAAMKAWASWKRSSGRLASALRTMPSKAAGTCTLSSDGAIGSSFSTLCMIVVSWPVKGFSPVRNW